MNNEYGKSLNLRKLPIQNYRIDLDTLNHLSPLHRLVAESALRDGRWILIDDSKNEGDQSKPIGGRKSGSKGGD